MPSIFVTRAVPHAGLEKLKSHFQKVTVSPVDRPLTRQELVEGAKDCEGLLTMLTDPIDAEFLTACPQLKAVSQFAVGVNNIDIAACTARGIGVSNTPGVLTNATAETAWVLLFAAARRAVEAADHLREGAWSGWGPLQFLGQGVIGKTLGVIGAGRIGERFALMSRGFDMHVLYHQRRPNERLEKELGARKVPLDQLLRESDFIALHTPLTPETRHLIGEAQLRLMKKTAVLVNTSRGPVIDEAALLRALREGWIFAAGLDVFEFEPEVTAGLLDQPNAVCLPHIGSATVETRDRMSLMTADGLIDMLAGKRPMNAVNPGVWS